MPTLRDLAEKYSDVEAAIAFNLEGVDPTAFVDYPPTLLLAVIIRQNWLLLGSAGWGTSDHYRLSDEAVRDRAGLHLQYARKG